MKLADRPPVGGDEKVDDVKRRMDIPDSDENESGALFQQKLDRRADIDLEGIIPLPRRENSVGQDGLAVPFRDSDGLTLLRDWLEM